MLYWEKSQPSPGSLDIEKLKSSGTYRTAEVIQRVSDDFKNKCYICGSRSNDFNVEHFFPHEDDVNLKFSWNNLFWSCGRCNNIKSNKYKNLLNCTDRNDNCEQRIKYIYDGFATDKPKIDALDNDPRTVETAELVQKVYDGTTLIKQKGSENFLRDLHHDFIDFQTNIGYYFDMGPFDLKDDALIKIRKHLHHTSKFTEFKRWAIRRRPDLFKEFEKFFV